MVDTVDSATRSRIMAQVHGINTGPEIALRTALFARGLRYRLHRKDLPGKPDLVFPRHRVVVFVHGCLWHWHGCARSRMPETNTKYWQTKIARNQARDREHVAALTALDWRVLTVWECALKVRTLNQTADATAHWIRRKSETVGAIEPSTTNISPP